MRATQPQVARYYMKMQVETAPREKQLTMLHEKCVDLISVAIGSSGEERRRSVEGAQNILAQFQSALRVRDAVSQSLFYIYDYSYVLLEHGSAGDCVNAREVMVVLRNTFRRLLRRSSH